MKLENKNNKILDDLITRNENWEKLNGIPEKVSGTELKVAKVERELYQFSDIVSNINTNQEAKQSVSGRGVIGLPKTVGEGYAVFSIKGVTDENGLSTQGAMRVKSVGKNLFDKDNLGIVYGYYNNTNGSTMPHAIYVITKIPIFLKKGIRYYTKPIGGEGFFPNYSKVTDLEGNYLGNMGFSVSKSYINEIQDVLVYLCIHKDNIDEFELEKNTIATPYEPYKETTQYINAPTLRSLPNVYDEVKNGKFIQRVSDTGTELADPIITEIETTGNLVAYPNGTVYIEQVVADAGMYTTKMEILNTELPIKTIDKLSKVDYTTGLEHQLDISKAIVSGTSFTHPDLVENDIVFFEYYYDLESTNGNASIEYFDSRYTITDSVTDKIYKWTIAIADGVPSIEIEEV